MTEHADAAQQRSDGYSARADRPAQRRSAEPDDAPRAAPVGGLSVREVRNEDGDSSATVVGMASVTEVGYEMYDMFGPYTEVVSADAFDKTLGQSPLVEFTLNHARGGGPPMAHTRNETLTLSVIDAETSGLGFSADVDPSRSDVADVLKALKRGDLAEASFKFRIVRGQWSPDYTEYRIEEVDLHRGDVSAVNFGANPNATSALRDEAPAAKLSREDRERLVPLAETHHRR